jgi:hypothetical protein
MLLHKVLTVLILPSGKEGIIQTTDEAIDYFGISVVTPKDKLVEKKGYTYQRISGNQLTEVRVPPSRFYVSPSFNKRDVRKIKVPRESFTEKGNQKTFSFSFPRRVKNVIISLWLSENCKQHKPIYFLTEAGRACPVWDFSEVLSGQ